VIHNNDFLSGLILTIYYQQLFTLTVSKQLTSSRPFFTAGKNTLRRGEGRLPKVSTNLIFATPQGKEGNGSIDTNEHFIP
jgi:hypothetical protein